MPVKQRIFLITALLYILYTIFPLFGDSFGIPVWLPSMAAFLIMLSLYPQAYTNKVCSWFLVYAAVLLLFLLMGRPLFIGIGSVEDNRKLFIEYAFILPTISIFSILVYLKDNELIDKLIKWSVIILFVSFVVAVPLMLTYNSIREALSTENNEELRISGLPGYSLMHAYPLFLPVLCYCFRVFSGKNKIIAFLALIILCFVIYDTFVSTSLVVMIFVLLFSLIYSDRNESSIWIVLIGIALLAFVLYEIGFFVSLIDTIMPAFEDTAVEPKLNDIKESMIQGHVTGTSLTARQDHHAASIDAFLQNPLFGTPKAGSHSSILDRFGGMGIVAGIPFIMIVISYLIRMKKFYKTKKARAFFLIGIIIGFIYLYQKGNWGCENWLFFMVLMPMGLLSAENMLLNEHKKRCKR